MTESKEYVEDELYPKLSPITAWLSGVFVVTGIATNSTVCFGIGLAFAGLSYIAYRWRRCIKEYSPAT